MTNPSELRVYQEDPSFDFDGDLEGGTNVPVAQDHSNISSPSLTPVGMIVRDERKLFRDFLGAVAPPPSWVGYGKEYPRLGDLVTGKGLTGSAQNNSEDLHQANLNSMLDIR